MEKKQTNYLQLIYRLAIGLIALWFMSIIWPYISDVVLMLVFAFLFTTVLDIIKNMIQQNPFSIHFKYSTILC